MMSNRIERYLIKRILKDIPPKDRKVYIFAAICNLWPEYAYKEPVNAFDFFKVKFNYEGKRYFMKVDKKFWNLFKIRALKIKQIKRSDSFEQDEAKK